MNRGEIWWAELGEPVGSAPGFHRPLLIVQCDQANQSRLGTVICAALSSNQALASMPGNVPVAAQASGLPKDSVVNVSQIVTIDKSQLHECLGNLPRRLMTKVDVGLKRQLDLW